MGIYLYKGNEEYLMNTKIELLIKESKANEFNISTYDCSEVNLGLAVQDAQTLPFLCDSKVVVIKNPVFLSSEKQTIIHDVNSLMKYIDCELEQTMLIINAYGVKINEKSELYQKLVKKANVNETKEIDEIEFKGWLKRQCDINHVGIDDEAIKSFYLAVGKNLINAKNELDKIVLYVGKGGTITKEIVKELSSRGLQNNIYNLTGAIFSKNKQMIYSIYEDLVSSGIDTNVLIGLTTKSMKDNLIVNLMLEEGATQADIARRLNVSNSRAYYLVKDAKSLNIESIKKYIVELGKLDFSIKSGQVDPKKGFEFFLFSLI